MSVVVGAHTRVQFLKRAVESVVRQGAGGPGADEIIVVKFVEDRDGLDAELRRLGARVFITDQPQPGAKFAEGIKLATGDVICYLDDDDVFLPGKVQRVREVFRDPRVVLHGHRYLPFTGTPPEHGEMGPLRLFNTALGDQYWDGLRPVVSSCVSVRAEMIRPWVDDLMQLGVSDHTTFMMAVMARKWIAMDRSILSAWQLNQVKGVLRPANSIWAEAHGRAGAENTIRWMLGQLDAQTDGVRETLNPIVVRSIIHLVFKTGDTQFHEYRRTMRGLLAGVGVRRPLVVGTTLLFAYPLSPRLAVALSQAWTRLVGFRFNPA